MSGVCWLVVAVVLAASYLIPTAVFAILERRDKRAALRTYDKIMALHGYEKEIPMATQADLHASERAMQMICATIHNGQQKFKQMWDIEKIVNAWVHHPDKLTPDAMKEDLPDPGIHSASALNLDDPRHDANVVPCDDGLT